MIKEFLDLYDPTGDLSFNNVTYRPAASFSTPFGLDNTFGTLRLHAAIDRGYSPSSIYNIYSPFAMSKIHYEKSYWSYGTMTFLTVAEADFDVRIAHIGPDNFREPFKNQIVSNTLDSLDNRDLFAEAGNIGTSSGVEIVPGKAGAHTHTEIVSRAGKSSILDYVLLKKIGEEKFVTPYSIKDITDFAYKTKSSDSAFNLQYIAELNKRNISFINGYRCVRKDYLTGEVQTFYNSQALFGF